MGMVFHVVGRLESLVDVGMEGEIEMSSGVRRCAAVLSLTSLSVVFLLAHSSLAMAAPGAFDLISPTNGAWCTATCTFSWQGSSSAVSYQLYVDGALKRDAIAPASPLGYTLTSGEAVADGWHTWSVVAKDSTGGTQQSTSTFSVRVDASPPTAPALLLPAANAWVASYTPTISWTGSTDVGSGLAGYEIWLNGASASTGIAASATSSTVNLPAVTMLDTSFATTCPGSWVLSGSGWGCGISSGAYHLTFATGYFVGTKIGTATMPGVLDLSNAGHADITIYHEELNPTATLEVNASSDGGANWQLVKKLPPVQKMQYARDTFSIDDATGTTSAKINLYGSAGPNEGWVIDWLNVKAVLGGPYTWQVVAVDTAGNRTGSEIRQLQYDLPPLPFALVSPPDSTWVANSTPTFTWNATTDAGSGLAKYQVWIDGALVIDAIPATATSAVPTTALTDATHAWRVYAVDAAGAVRRSSQSFALGVDTTPPQTFGITGTSSASLSLGCESTFTIPTPALSWNPSSDAGSGLDHYQLIIDGTLSRDGILPGSAGSATPSAPLAEGVHTYTVKAVDKVGNVQTSANTCGFAIDFNPPSAFNLVSPVDHPGYPSGTVIPVVSLTPTFSWTPSASTGSGLAHYELYVSDPAQSDNLVCVECSIPSTATSVTVTKPVAAGIHAWNVRAVDHVGGFTWANATNQTGTSSFNAQCTGTCGSAPETAPELGPEAGAEPAPEPSRDGGIDAPMDSSSDGPASTATSTATATSSQTATGTSTTTATSTATSTSVAPEPQPDGAPVAGVDAVVSDAAVSRDGLQQDGVIGGSDAAVTTVGPDGSSITSFHDGGTTLADSSALGTVDATGAKLDVGRAGGIDGAGYDGGGANGKAGSSGCGCALGTASPRTLWGVPFAIFALLAFRGRSRLRICRSEDKR